MLLFTPHQYSGKARRIVSLVPSQTELLYYLGLEDEVAGITKFCIHPDLWHRNKSRVGGTKNIDIQKIESIQPDLIIANKEENTKEDIDLLVNKFEVFVTDVHNLGSAIKMITDIGVITGKTGKAFSLSKDITDSFATLPLLQSTISAAYFIWKDPLMTIGSDTFIHDMLQRASFENVFADRSRYPEVSLQEIQHKNPELILLSSEPYPFKQKHIDWLQAELPKSKIILADGEMFSWYGSRLLQSVGYFKELYRQLNLPVIGNGK